MHPKLTLWIEIWNEVFPFKRTHCIFLYMKVSCQTYPCYLMLMRQKCLLSDSSDSVIDFQIIFILNGWSSILMSTCLLFSVKLFNTDVPTIRETLDNSLGLKDDMRFLVSTTRPRGQACKSSCKLVQLYTTSLFIFVIHYFFCMAWKCQCKFFFSWNDTIMRPISDPKTYGCRFWIWGSSSVSTHEANDRLKWED